MKEIRFIHYLQTKKIIKEADKGESAIIIDTKHYKNMLNDSLMDVS